MSKQVIKYGIIDIEIDIYKECFNAEQVTDWGDDVVTVGCDIQHVVNNISDKVKDYVSFLELEMYTLALSDSRNFRKTVDPSYKGNRKNSRKPVGLRAVKEKLMETHPCRAYPNVEADDVIGISMSDPQVKSHPKYPHLEFQNIGISTDKDMMTIPGNLWRCNWEDPTILEVSEFDANRNWMFQTLTGDTTDGYSGVKGVGKVGAEKLLAKCETFNEMWDAVVKAFGGDVDAAVQSARLARILRYGDYDHKTKEVILWEPK